MFILLSYYCFQVVYDAQFLGRIPPHTNFPIEVKDLKTWGPRPLAAMQDRYRKTVFEVSHAHKVCSYVMYCGKYIDHEKDSIFGVNIYIHVVMHTNTTSLNKGYCTMST